MIFFFLCFQLILLRITTTSRSTSNWPRVCLGFVSDADKYLNNGNVSFARIIFRFLLGGFQKIGASLFTCAYDYVNLIWGHFHANFAVLLAVPLVQSCDSICHCHVQRTQQYDTFCNLVCSKWILKAPGLYYWIHIRSNHPSPTTSKARERICLLISRETAVALVERSAALGGEAFQFYKRSGQIYIHGRSNDTRHAANTPLYIKQILGIIPRCHFLYSTAM